MHKPKIAIVGTGPAALMAASVLLMKDDAVDVTLFEKRKSPGRKILIAGSSGLNITHDESTEKFPKFYSSHSTNAALRFSAFFKSFSPTDWLEFVQSLGIQTFKGTSRRYFTREMKSSKFLRAWLGWLAQRKALLRTGYEFKEIIQDKGKTELLFANGEREQFDFVIFALGGASYEEVMPGWVDVFKQMGLKFHEFKSSNCGYTVKWPEKFIQECAWKPIKNIRFTNSKGSMEGDLMITPYGLEGTPVYALGKIGPAFLDLKPRMKAEEIKTKVYSAKENLSPIRKLVKQLGLSDEVQSLLFHMSDANALQSDQALIESIKSFRLQLEQPRPLNEAISSSGGLSFDELDEDLQLKNLPNVFAIGEMLDWDAPTGGFLIQGCVSQGAHAANGLLKKMKSAE